MPKEHIYRTQLVWTGASQGSTSSYESYAREYTVTIEGKPPLVGSADPTFRGNPTLHNPEDLLVISLASCHMLSYLALCAHAGIQVIAYSDEAVGKMTRQDGKVRFTEVMLHPRVAIAVGDDIEKARSLHHNAHDECFIANSVAFPVRNEPIVFYADDPQISQFLLTT
ncbi:MAG TPA: OsmC family protein [Coleofasciculaceae cyanobacterium]